MWNEQAELQNNEGRNHTITPAKYREHLTNQGKLDECPNFKSDFDR